MFFQPVEDVEDVPSLSDKVVFKRELGNSCFLFAEIYDKLLRIHIRRLETDENSDSLNGYLGVKMNLRTFYEFSIKLKDFNLMYKIYSFVANNKVLALCLESKASFQNLREEESISLCEEQLTNLQLYIPECCDFLKRFVMKYYLPAIISYKIPTSENDVEDENALQSYLVRSIEEELRETTFKRWIPCRGCVANSPSQLRHECVTYTDYEKFILSGERLCITMDFGNIVKRFKQKTLNVSRDFLKNVNSEIIYATLFRYPGDNTVQMDDM